MSPYGFCVLGAGDSHGWLQQRAFQKYAVITEGLVDSGQDLLLDGSSLLNIVVAVHQDLGLNDGHQA